jgi:hypothetical protein
VHSVVDSKALLQEILDVLISSDALHAKWVNTISYLENCGARKIAACEHPTLVKEEMLKHASEEFRHAHYLKSQIERISDTPISDYSLPNLIGGIATLRYLEALDVQTCRYLSKTIGMDSRTLRAVAYLLVTYAIEVRAEEFYPIYDSALRDHGSKIAVKSILLEEKEHLAEMREGLAQIHSGEEYAKYICSLEEILYQKWLTAVADEILPTG